MPLTEWLTLDAVCVRRERLVDSSDAGGNQGLGFQHVGTAPGDRLRWPVFAADDCRSSTCLRAAGDRPVESFRNRTSDQIGGAVRRMPTCEPTEPANWIKNEHGVASSTSARDRVE